MCSAARGGSATDVVTRWFLSVRDRGNSASRIDAEHPEVAWSTGNVATPLIDGSAYFADLYRELEATRSGDLVMFTDWQGDPDERLTDDPDSELAAVLLRAIDRGVDVRSLVWRSHAGVLGFSAGSHRKLGLVLQDNGADLQLDMRVRPMGAHHQKFLVIRHADDQSRDVAFVGGIDLCHGRRDTPDHNGDPQADEFSAEYGSRPPWHDVQLELRGPVVRDVETVFRERWVDTTPSTRNPLRRIRDRNEDLDEQQHRLPEQLPAPPAIPDGVHAVQLRRTYPHLGVGWAYDFAPKGERSIAGGFTRALGLARGLVSIEDQFLWGRGVADVLVEALQREPELHLVAILPQYPDTDGWFARDPQLLGRRHTIRRLQEAAPDRVAFYGLENHAGTPVYVHAKVVVVDDVWATIGSDNLCRRSWTNDSELTAAVIDTAVGDHEAAGAAGRNGQLGYARRLRLTLAAEHLDRLDPGAVEQLTDAELLERMADCITPADMLAAYGKAAETLEAWHREGQRGPRPAGRLRRLPDITVPWVRRMIARPSYRYLHDPDGRALPHRNRTHG